MIEVVFGHPVVPMALLKLVYDRVESSLSIRRLGSLSCI
jgi:hypothetical protein